MPEAGHKANLGLIPPWLWFWLVMYILSLPTYFNQWQQDLETIFLHQPPPTTVSGASLFYLLGLAGLLELLPVFALFIGVVLLLFPKSRAIRLEREYKLADPPSLVIVQEITDFLYQHAPGIRIKANLRRFDGQYAFVYPLGFRRTAIAIFGLLAILWRADRPAAEAVLLHELAHYHHGDGFIVGAGSLFRALLEKWFYFFCILLPLPILLVFIEQTISFFSEIFTFSSVIYKIGQIPWLLFGLVLQTITMLFWTASVFILPLMSIWCSELNADQTAVRESPNSILKAVERLPDETQWLKWLFFRMSHPPNRVRQWFITHSENKAVLILLLLLFPLAYLVRLLLITAKVALVDVQVASIDLLGEINTGLETLVSVWWMVVAILVLWSFITVLQRRSVSGKLKQSLKIDIYLISAGILAAISLLVSSFSHNFLI